MDDEGRTEKVSPFVVWDSYGLDLPYSGIGRHGQLLFSNLKEQGLTPTLVSPWGLTQLPGSNRTNAIKNFVKKLKIFWPDLSVWQAEKIEAGISSGSEKKILHGLSNFNSPILSKKKQGWQYFLTVHDPIPFLAPESVSRAYRLQLQAMWPKLCKRVDRFVVVSDWTGEVLADLFPSIASRISVIRNGFPDVRFLGSSVGGDQSVLVVSRFEHYKGFDKLVSLINGKSSRTFKIVTDVRGAEYIARSVQPSNMKRVQVFMHIDQSKLEALYQSASVLFHPSQYEGYGLPLAEAMSYGIPVVCFAGSATSEFTTKELHEVLNWQATVDQISDSIEDSIVKSGSSSYRSRLREHILQQQSWSESSSRLKYLYENA